MPTVFFEYIQKGTTANAKVFEQTLGEAKKNNIK